MPRSLGQPAGRWDGLSPAAAWPSGPHNHLPPLLPCSIAPLYEAEQATLVEAGSREKPLLPAGLPTPLAHQALPCYCPCPARHGLPGRHCEFCTRGYWMKLVVVVGRSQASGGCWRGQ